jgi:hypothetical protein
MPSKNEGLANKARKARERKIRATERLAAAAVLLNDAIAASEIHCEPNYGRGQTSIKAAFSRIEAFTSAIAAYRETETL